VEGRKAEGHVDVVDGGQVTGWAAFPDDPQPLTVEIFLDRQGFGHEGLGRQKLGECVADGLRPDVAAAGRRLSARCGFMFRCDLSGADYGARVHVRAKGGFGELHGSGRFVRPANGPKLFFIHIPKTAGSTINAIADELIGRAAEHVENLHWQDTVAFGEFNFLSGHLSCQEPIRLYQPLGFRFFTILRDPVDQLISHLRWVRQYAKLSPEAAWEQIDPRNYEIALHLARAQPDLRSQLECLIALCEDPELGDATRPLFDNCLTRYLVAVSASRLVDPDDVRDAKTNLARFDLVGVQSHLAATLAALEGLTGLPWSRHANRRENTSGEDRVVGSKEAAADLLKELCWADQDIYRTALAQSLGPAGEGRAAMTGK
jgi:hypothetical protein